MPPVKGKENSYYICLVLHRTAGGRERKTIPRADPLAVHGILYSMGCFLHHQTHCLLREAAQQGLISSLDGDSKEKELWDKPNILTKTTVTTGLSTEYAQFSLC